MALEIVRPHRAPDFARFVSVGEVTAAGFAYIRTREGGTLSKKFCFPEPFTFGREINVSSFPSRYPSILAPDDFNSRQTYRSAIQQTAKMDAAYKAAALAAKKKDEAAHSMRDIVRAELAPLIASKEGEARRSLGAAIRLIEHYYDKLPDFESDDAGEE
jgi:hypothetical protein